MAATMARTNQDWSDFFARVDIAALGHSELLAELLPGGHLDGREFRCGSLNGEPGSSFGFNLDSGVWKDFAGGPGGKGLCSLYARIHGVKNGAAALELARRFGIDAPKLHSVNGKPTTAKQGSWRPIAPFAPELRVEHHADFHLPAFPPDWGRPTSSWLYLDDTGRPWNYRVRFDKDGGKDIRPLSWCVDDKGQHAWRWRDLPAPRFLWNVEKLYQLPDLPVLVVEGEKTADAAERLYPGFVVVSWPGGAGNEHHTDWKPLLNRQTSIFLWPDADLSNKGQDAMLRIAAMFPAGANIHIIKPDPNWPDGWDLADLENEGWTVARAETWLTEHATPAEIPITPSGKRPQCSLATQDHGVLQSSVWTAIKELNHKKDGPYYFFMHNQRGGELRLIRPTPFGDKYLSTLSSGSLRAHLTRDIYFYTVNTYGERSASPDSDLLASLLAAPADLPVLNRYVRIPVFARDGRLISTPGYDKLSGIYYAPAPWVGALRVSEAPTEADMRAAMEVVEDILCDFMFATAADRANAYALMLLPIMREMIDGPTPMHRIEAPSFGTGKSLLLSILLLPTVDGSMWIPEIQEEEEWRKTLVGALRDNWPAILIDNARHLNSSTLLSLLTAPETWGARRLGTDDMPQYRVSCVFGCTVNNPNWSIEIHRRMLPIRLDSKSEHPFERTGWRHPHIRQYVQRRRGRILSALLTLARYGLNHPTPFSRTKGSFEAWAMTMGPVLGGLGFDSFLEQRAEQDISVGSDGMADLFEVIWSEFPSDNGNSDESRRFSVGDIYSLVARLDTLTLAGNSETARKTSLGMKLLECRDQVRRGLCLSYLGISGGKKQYKLIRPT